MHRHCRTPSTCSPIAYAPFVCFPLADRCTGMEIHLGGDAADADEGSSIPTIAEMQAVVERECGAAYMGCMGYALSLIGTIAANPTSCSWCEEFAALQKGTGGRISYALVIIAHR